MATSTPLSRRTYLGAVAGIGTGLTAGCLGRGGEDERYEHVVLDEPEQYPMFREARDDGEIDYPVYADELPEYAAPCTVRGREVTSGEFLGERHTMYTFVFTRCHGACPGLVSGLRHVQADSVDEGYEDDVGLLSVTFDPEYDTPDVLEEYGTDLGVEYDVDNWYFLRPETEADAHHLVESQFGCYFARNPNYEGEGHGGGHDDDDDHGGHDEENGHDHDEGDDYGENGGHGHDEGDRNERDSDDGNGMEMAFQHESMVVLANADGYVERTYVGSVPSPDVLIDDARTLVERWS